MMKRFVILVLAAMAAAGTFAATYGPWGESDAVKNPDKLGPTYLMNMPLTINGTAAVQGDCVAVYRQDTSALCGLGKVLDSSGKLTLVCYAPQSVVLHFKVWVSASGTMDPTILDCAASCDLLAPAPGSFFTGHSLFFQENSPVEAIVATPVITPADGATFADSCTIEISCSTANAQIYYTTNGSTPKTSTKNLYKGPFTVTDSVVIKAVATKEGLTKSEYATATISKLAMTLENALGVTSDMVVITGGAEGWEPVKDTSVSTGTLSARSGLKNADDDSESWIEVSLSGVGTLTYYAKTSCEYDDDGTCTWDRLMVFADGVERRELRMDGESGWVRQEVSFNQAGLHTMRWVYFKDESDYDGEDCAWIYGVTWTPMEVLVEPIPDIGKSPTANEVQDALTGSADKNLFMNITTGAEYNSYRSWANVVKKSDGSGLAGQQAVKDSPYAWLSYALDSEKLIDSAPVDGDLVIHDFKPFSESASFEFTISLANIAIGAAATESHLKKIFEITGASSLSGDSFEVSNVCVIAVATRGGKAVFIVGPKDTTLGSFFIKAKML